VNRGAIVVRFPPEDGKPLVIESSEFGTLLNENL
jgi:hypothetical protein